MKKLYLLVTVVLFFNGFIFSQTAPKFKLTKDGIHPVVINFADGNSAASIYTKVKAWIKLNNSNPQAVTRIDKENLVKFSCRKEKAWKVRSNNFDYWNELQYTLSVDIKDNKCRVTFDTEDTRYKAWFNNDGTLIKKFNDSIATFEGTVNETLTSLYNYLKGNVKKTADNW